MRKSAAIFCVFALVVVAVLLFHRLGPRPPHAGASTGPREVARTTLVFEEGQWRQPGSGWPFSGWMVEYYPGGTLRSRSAVTNGLLHGLSEGWYTNAHLQVTEHFKEGVSHGVRTKWYPGGARQSEANIVEGKLSGAFRKWHENGALSEEVEFVDGQPEGISLAYFPSGCLKARVVMKDGKPIEREFWKDGERKG